MTDTLLHTICQHIAATRGGNGAAGTQHSIGGGCINQTRRIHCDGQPYFLKTNRASLAPMFHAEALGLNEILGSSTVRVPATVCWSSAGNTAYLVMEDLELGGRGSASQLGEQLAALHRVTQSRFGWHTDNTIGSTPQINTTGADWISFWREQRLGYQLSLAADNGFGGKLQHLGERLLADFPALFDTYQPIASLLHGDLWGGNHAYLKSGEPVIFDPACYYGDREADLAMTELFGGFDATFYHSYNEHYPLDKGYGVRKNFYNLYHVLNHANLFGGGYASQAQNMMESLLSELRA